MVLEICVDSLESAVTAAKGGADRVELCSDLMEGGITPSSGLIQSVRAQIGIDLYVMIRPRGGDSLYSDSELEVMEADITEVKRLGADGVVLGVLTADGRVDIASTHRLVKLAAPMKVTFHRAIDMTTDLGQACEDVATAGAHRILTSGGKQTALVGAEQIAELVRIAGDKMSIMAGSGINAHNVARVARTSAVSEFHASLRKRVISPVRYRNDGIRMGTQKNAEFIRYQLMEADVHALRSAIDCLAETRCEEHSAQ